MKPDFLTELLRTKSMVICCGGGGVGKTTTAAVLALKGAMLGRKSLVLTIDPAKRLANSLGLESLGNRICRVEDRHLRNAGLNAPGELYAMMLDCKRTFDDLVRQYAPSEQVARNILENRYYQHVSDALTGSHEYMAMEKLYEIHERGDFDLLVLDTPPTHNALDFLDAPNRMSNFLDDSVLKWFIRPYFVAGKLSLGAMKKGGKFIFGILEKITGLQVLQDLSEFFLAFSGMYEGFKSRALKVRDLLRDQRTSFVIVTSPNRLTIEESIFFYRQLMLYEMPFGGFIVNKFHMDYGLAGEAPHWHTEVNARLLRHLMQNAQDFRALHALDLKAVDHLAKEITPEQAGIRKVRYFDEDIFAMKDLKRMLEEIFPIH